MVYTAAQITRTAILQLEARSCYVWRANNLPVPGRKFIGERGMPDICGFHKTSGKAVYCEVKTSSDRMSEAQINFMIRAKAAGCFCLIATEERGNIIVKDWIREGEI